MRTLFALMAWCFLFVLCWPVALLRALLFLPARVLGFRDRRA